MFFYIPDLNQSKLEKPQTDHFFSMRVRFGQVLTASNLAGDIAKIKINKLDRKDRTLEYKVLSKVKKQKPPKKSLYQAILDKNYLEKLVEILPLAEVNQLYLFYSEFSLKNKIKLDRLNKILIRSCEQAENPFLPKIQILDTLQIFNCLDPKKQIVLEKNPNFYFRDFKKLSNPTDLSPLVGPEGGWSKAEIQAFKEKNLKLLSLKGIVYPSWLAGGIYFWQSFTLL